MIGLVDCNNFYASCERLFRPDLAGKPIAVLSNNDGCIIARSEEAKQLGVEMGAPYFKIRNQLSKKNVVIFSSNYPLYGSMSARVMRILEQFSPDVEVYSIDEAFIHTAGVRIDNLINFGELVRQRVFQWAGLPVCLGFGSTKTLAKIANRIAKKHTFNGVFVIDESNVAEVLQQLMVEDVWGIGRRSAVKLRQGGIVTAFDLYNANDDKIRQILGIAGLRTAWELRGINAVVEDPVQAKSVSSSRSFGTAVSELHDLREALSCYVETAYRKLRRQELFAGGISVYLKTNRHDPKAPQYSNLAAANLDNASCNLGELIKIANHLLSGIYRSGYRYIKTGVVFSDLTAELRQPSLFDVVSDTKPSSELDDALVKIEHKFGKNAVFHAIQGTERKWKMKQSYLSPNYTTRWSDIPSIKI